MTTFNEQVTDEMLLVPESLPSYIEVGLGVYHQTDSVYLGIPYLCTWADKHKPIVEYGRLGLSPYTPDTLGNILNGLYDVPQAIVDEGSPILEWMIDNKFFAGCYRIELYHYPCAATEAITLRKRWIRKYFRVKTNG